MAENVMEKGTAPIKGLQGISSTEREKLREESRQALAIAKSGKAGLIGSFDSLGSKGERLPDINIQGVPFGESVYDPVMPTSTDYFNANNTRGEEQGTAVKWLNGAGKGLVLAGTTFLSGSVGYATGIANAIYEGNLDAFVDEPFSMALDDVNQWAEKVMPNYYRDVERDRAWYQNLGTANFWADSILKNTGFLVGAYFSGKVMGPLGLLKPLSQAKVLKPAVTLLRRGKSLSEAFGIASRATKASKPMSKGIASFTGSFLSAVNEGRIEGLHAMKEYEDEQILGMKTAYDQAFDEIVNSNMSDAEKNRTLQQLDTRTQELEADMRTKADRVGLITMLGNLPVLTANNIFLYGRLYAQGFKSGGFKNFKEGLDTAIKNNSAKEAAKKIIKQGNEYIVNLSKKKAALKGLSMGASEGFEELTQKWVSEGSKSFYSPETTDSYYRAMTDENATIQTNGFLAALADGFAKSYGDPEAYQEFFAGAIMGLFGMPTFGKQANSGSSTWLGKGKKIGISGGIFGEISNAAQEIERLGGEVSNMNQFLRKVEENKRHLVQSNHFTDLMSGFSEDGNTLEMQNAKDSDDFALIASFARTGKMEDLKEIVNADFEGMTDEEINQYVLDFSPNIRRDDEGNVTTTNPDGTPIQGVYRDSSGLLFSPNHIRQMLIEKRDKMLSQIDLYSKAVDKIEYYTQDRDIDDSYKNELAWLGWKKERFKGRAKEILSNDKNQLITVRNAINDFINRYFSDVDISGVKSEKDLTDKSKKQKFNLTKVSEFLEALSSDKLSPEAAGLVLKESPELIEFLGKFMRSANHDLGKFTDTAIGPMFTSADIDFGDQAKLLNDLRDVGKLGILAETFSNKLQEYVLNPEKIQENRDKIDNEKEEKKDAEKKVVKNKNVKDSEVKDLTNSVQEGSIDEDDLADIAGSEDKDAANKANIAMSMVAAYNTARTKIVSSNQPEQVKNDALALLKNSLGLANSLEELLDTSTEAFNDVNVLYDESDETLQGKTPEEIQDALQERLDLAKSLIEQVKSEIDLQEHNTSTSENKGSEDTTGSDPTPSVPTANQQEKKVEEKKDIEESIQAVDDVLKEMSNNFLVAIKENYPNLEEQWDNLVNDVTAVLADIETVLAANTSYSKNTLIRGLTSLAKLKADYGIDEDLINAYVNNIVKLLREKHSLTQNLDSLNEKKEEIKATQIQEPKINTPTISEEEANKQQEEQANHFEEENRKTFLGEKYDFWKPTMSHYPFIKLDERSLEPFYKVARTLKNNKGESLFTEAQLKRIEAVGQYFEEHGVFELVESGQVQKGSKVFFTTDKSLNDKAGEVVILMTDEQGRVIGDIMSPNDASFKKQVGLDNLVNRFIEEYQKAGSPETFILKNSKGDNVYTTVAQNLVGRAPFTDNSERHTLNEVFTDERNGNVPFQLGISMADGSNPKLHATPGKKANGTPNEVESTTLSPLTGKLGQPFLLLPTSIKGRTGAYLPLPITMKPFSNETLDTALGKEILYTLDKIIKSNNANVLKAVVDPIMELLSLKDFKVYYSTDPTSGEQTVKITANYLNNPNLATQLEGGSITLYEGPLLNEFLAQEVAQKLYGQPFNISRRWVNGKYYGEEDYNRMVGEIASINLPIGTLHTVNDWFTVNPLDSNLNVLDAGSVQTKGKTEIEERRKASEKIPTKQVDSFVRIEEQGKTLFVNTKTWEVFDNQQKYSGIKADLFIAKVYGQLKGLDTTKPYQTPKGFYDPIGNKFISPKEVSSATTTNPATLLEQDLGQEVKQTSVQPTQNENEQEYTIQYTPKGKERQTYTIKGTHIYNKNGEEVFSADAKNTGTDRNKIYANLAVQQGRAVVIEHNGHTYVVNNRGQIISATSGQIMKWDEKHGIRKAIVTKAQEKFNQLRENNQESQPNNSTFNTQSQEEYERYREKLLKQVNAEKQGEYLKYTDDDGELIYVSCVQMNTGDYKVTYKIAGGGSYSDVFTKEQMAFFGSYKNFLERKERIGREVDGKTIYSKEQFIFTEPSSFEEQHEGKSIDSFLEKKLTRKAQELGISHSNDTNTPNTDNQIGQNDENKNIELSSLGDNDLHTMAKKAGFHRVCQSQSQFESIWNNLTREQRTLLLSSKNRSAVKKALSTLSAAFEDGKFNTVTLGANSPTEAINRDLGNNPKYRKEEVKTKAPIENRKEARMWLERVLPQLSTKDRYRIVEGLIKISQGEDAEWAYGMFHKGIMTISDKAADGTTYHEAFHAVVGLLLSDTEINRLFNAAKQKYGNLSHLELEEKLAEDFRRYVQLNQESEVSNDKWYKKIFRTLKYIATKLKGYFDKPSYIDSLFYEINNGQFKNRTIRLQNNSVNYSQEMQTIKDQAIADGTFMKAPNGKPTNLNERQWLQVRTKAFKDWFGDWENNPENASKVVDENGEPLVVYHNTTTNFSVFERGHDFKNITSHEFTFHFGTQETANKRTSEISMPVFLNIRTLIEGYDGMQNSSIEFINELMRQNVISKESFNALRDKLSDAANDFAKNHKQRLDKQAEIIENVLESHDKPYFGVAYSNNIEGNGEYSYMVINPNQIKSATDNIGTFSKKNDDIRYRIVTEKSLEPEESEGQRQVRVIRQWQRDKLMYGNLSQEQKDYLKERGISTEEYSEMSPFEREVLFRCM